MATTAKIAKEAKSPKFKVRLRNRCQRCGRPRAFLRKFALCRLCFRKLALDGDIAGVTKSSVVREARQLPASSCLSRDAECTGAGSWKLDNWKLTESQENDRSNCRHARADPQRDDCPPRRVEMPSSRLKVEIARILESEGYIQGFKVLERGRRRARPGAAADVPEVRSARRAGDHRASSASAGPDAACISGATKCRMCSRVSAPAS